MHEKWFISDTHFFHANILKFTDDEGNPVRKFDNVHDMNEYMVKKWNSVVNPQDYIYHLGDVTFRYDGAFQELMSRLNGRKRLILGNHDKIKGNKLLDWFEKVELWKGFKEFDFTATHIPARLESLRDGKFNVHGHTHQRKSPTDHHINVSVEVRDYTPVHIEELWKEIKSIN